MLHIAPQRRPTAAQLIEHPWLCSRMPSLYQPRLYNAENVQFSSSKSSSSLSKDGQHSQEEAHLKETVAATYRAIATSPQVAHLGPVAMSELARRRFRDKGLCHVNRNS